jgi:hypothetical protein
MGAPFAGPFGPMGQEPSFDEDAFGILCCSMIFVSIINFILHAMYAGPVIVASSHLAFDKEISLREALRIRGRTYYYLVMATIGYTFTLSLVYLGSTLIALIPCGCIFFFVPLVLLPYVAVLYSLYMPAIVLEGRRPRESVGRSAKLVRGWWWLVFRVIAGVLLIQTILTISSEIAFRGLGDLMVSWSSDLEIFSQAFSAAGLTLVYMFVRPILFITLTLLYYELRVKKEAFDLEMMIENF